MTSVLFVGPLILLFWTPGDICPGFQSQGSLACLFACIQWIPQIHLWCVTPADLLMASMAAEPFLVPILVHVHSINKIHLIAKHFQEPKERCHSVVLNF